MSRESKRNEWEKLVAQYESSGLSRKRWCEANGVALSQLIYWRKRLCGECGSTPAPSDITWCQVVTPTTRQANARLTVRVGAASVEVAPGFDGALLHAVVQALSPSSVGERL